MALDNDTLTTLYSAVTYDELRKDSIWQQVTDQRWTDGWVNGARAVNIPVPGYSYTQGTTVGTITDPNDSTGIRVQSRNKDGDWSIMTQATSSELTFTRSGGYAASNFVGWEDEFEAPWPVVEEYRSRQAYEVRNQIDTAILNAMRGFPNNTTTLGDGSDGDYIDASGDPKGSGASLPYEAIDGWATLCETRDLNAEASDAIGSKYAIMHPLVFKVLKNYLLDKGLSWDMLTESLLVNNSVLAARGFKGRLLGIDVFSSNKFPTPSGTASARHWDVLCGTSTAVAANVRSPLVQYFNAQANQITAQPGSVLRQAGDYGVLELDGANRMQAYNIDAHATD